MLWPAGVAGVPQANWLALAEVPDASPVHCGLVDPAAGGARINSAVTVQSKKSIGAALTGAQSTALAMMMSP